MTEKQKCQCQQICTHYGIEGQKGILTEECADVTIMMWQILSYYFGCEAEKRLDYFINQKLTRQIGRIESE